MARRPVAIAILAVCLGLMTASIWIKVTTSTQSLLDAITMFPLPLLGALVTLKKPDQPIGLLMLAIATALGAATFTDAALQVTGISETTAGMAQMFNHVSFAFMVGLFGLLLALFPTGRVASPRWRFLRWTSLAAVVLIAASGIFGAPDDASEPRGPLAIDGARAVLEFIGGIGLVLGFLSIVLGGLSVVARFRSGNATERAQIRWFAYGVATLVVLMLVSLVPVGPDSPLDALFEILLVVMVGLVLPGCIALGVLKHRLYDIDLVVNRTLVYGCLTAILVGTYLLVVVLLQLLLEPATRESDLAVAGSTLVVAALFRPVLRQVQSFIDQRFYRRKYDAAETLGAFSGRLREQVDLASLQAELVGVVGETMQPAHVSVWLRATGGRQ